MKATLNNWLPSEVIIDWGARFLLALHLRINLLSAVILWNCRIIVTGSRETRNWGQLGDLCSRLPTELPRICRRIHGWLHQQIYHWDHVYILCIQAQSVQTSTRTIYSTPFTHLNMSTQSQQVTVASKSQWTSVQIDISYQNVFWSVRFQHFH